MVPRLSFSGAKKGFTLAEILVVVALFGVIASLVFAPSVMLVRRLEEVRGELAAGQVMEYLLRRVGAEMRSSPRIFPSGPVVSLVRRDILGGVADDRLALWSNFRGETGVRAWMLWRPGPGKEERAGVYRWLLPLASPSTVKWENLDPKDGTLILPRAGSLRFSVLISETGEWSGEYSGSRPRGIRTTVTVGKDVFFYEDWLPPE